MKLIILLITTLFISTNCNNGANRRSFEFTYSVDIESTDGEKLEMWIPIPTSNTVQDISRINIDTDGLKYKLNTETDHGNKYIYINEGNGTTNDKTVTITFNVNRKEHSNEKYANVDPQKYLMPYFTVPTGGVFNSVIKDNNLSRDNVRGIYEYVLTGMHYGKPKNVGDTYYSDPWLSAEGKYGKKKVSRDKVVQLYKSAKVVSGDYTWGQGNSTYACDIGVGNCTDYHSYFMSLGRTMEIPVRFHMGFPIPSGEEGIVKGYHCWADYYVDGEGWYPVDISEADKAPEKTDYFFGTVDKDRVEMMVGRDFMLEGYSPVIANLFIYPLMEINDETSNKFKKKFRYKNL